MASTITNDDLFKLIQNGNKSITEKIDDVKQDITAVKLQLNEKISGIEQRVNKIQAENREIKIRQINIERQLKKNSLIFYGISEGPQEVHEDTLRKVQDIISSKIKVNLSITEISNAFRLGKKSDKVRPILVEFISIIKRREILYKRTELRGTNIFINEDLTPEDRQIRKVLVGKLKEAKAQSKTATLKGDKLIVDGVVYTYNDFVQDNTNLAEGNTSCYTSPLPRAVRSEPSTPSVLLEQNQATENISTEQQTSVAETEKKKKVDQEPKKYTNRHPEEVIKVLQQQCSVADPEKKRKLDQVPGKDTGATPKKIASYPTRSRHNSNK